MSLLICFKVPLKLIHQSLPVVVCNLACCIYRYFSYVLIRSQLVSQLIHVQLVALDFGPQGVINKIYNLLHHVLG